VTRITDMRVTSKLKALWWLFMLSLAGGGGILWRLYYRPHSLFGFVEHL